MGKIRALQISTGGGFTNNGLVKNASPSGILRLEGPVLNNGRFEIDPGLIFRRRKTMSPKRNTGILQIRIQGLGSHGLLQGHPDNTTVMLDGILEITLAEGYEPNLGDTFRDHHREIK